MHIAQLRNPQPVQILRQPPHRQIHFHRPQIPPPHDNPKPRDRRRRRYHRRLRRPQNHPPARVMPWLHSPNQCQRGNHAAATNRPRDRRPPSPKKPRPTRHKSPSPMHFEQHPQRSPKPAHRQQPAKPTAQPLPGLPMAKHHDHNRHVLRQVFAPSPQNSI